MPHKDPEERKRYNTEYRNRRYREDSAFRERRLLDRAKRKADLIAWFDSYKKTLSCNRCGENHPACLDFHHRDPKTKEREISSMLRCLLSKERIMLEVAKCEVLCSNCHRKEHYKKRL